MADGSPHEVVALEDRLGVLQAVRVVLALTALAIAGASTTVSPGGVAPLLTLSAVYLALTGGVEAVRQRARARALGAVQAMILVDGLYLAAVLHRTGGSGSLLAFLIYGHLVAVTLLVSYRTGLKLAGWHSLLVLAVASMDSPGRPAAAATLAVSLWLVTMATGVLSSLNERELRRSKGELTALAAMGRELERARHPDEIVELLLRHVMRAGVFRRAAIVVPGTPDRPVTGAVAWPNTVVAASCGWASHDPIVLEAAAQRAPLLVAELEPTRSPALGALLPDADNVVVYPLVADGEVIAGLAVERGGRRGRRIARRTVDVVGEFAAHAALALHNAWLLAEVQALATIDALTGLANRRILDIDLDREVAWSHRSGEPLSLVLLDLDNFKAVNDLHGHQMGDEVLRQVSQAVAGACRESDLVARYGGEELAVLLPGCPPAQAVAAAGRFRAAVAACDVPVAVTVSAGVASMPINAADGIGLVAAADGALYQAKRAGRDRVVRSRRRASQIAAISWGDRRGPNRGATEPPASSNLTTRAR